MSKNVFKKIAIALAAVGPGLFLIGYNIGTGSVTTMAKSGAEYGMSLFWALGFVVYIYFHFNGSLWKSYSGNRKNCTF